MSSNPNVNEESVIIPQRGRSTVAKRLTSSSSSSSPSFSRPRSSTKPSAGDRTHVVPRTSSPSGSRHALETRTASGVGRGVGPQDASGSSKPTIDASQSNEIATGGSRLTTEPEIATAAPLPETQAATTPDAKVNETPSETPNPTQPQVPPASEATDGPTGPSASGPLNRQQVQEVAELLFMSSTLDACFEMPSQFSTAASGSDPGVPSTEVSSGSDELEDSEEQDNGAVGGLEDGDSEELGEDEEDEDDDVDLDYEFVKNAPLIMQRFHAHGEASARVEAEALKLALHGTANRTSTGARRNEFGAGVRHSEDDDDDDGHKDENEEEEEEQEDEDALLQVYHDMLDELDKLHSEAVELEESILKLVKMSLSSLSNPPESSTDDSGGSNGVHDNDGANGPSTTQQKQSPRSQIVGVIAACLPVIRARKSNLLMAQELIDSALENLSITLRMESLGLE